MLLRAYAFMMARGETRSWLANHKSSRHHRDEPCDPVKYAAKDAVRLRPAVGVTKR